MIEECSLMTIGMPIKNRAFCIKQVLKNIEELDYPKDKIKIVFVDDYSTDGTFEILTEWKNEVESKYYRICIIRAKSNIPQARNICVKSMEGDYILFWDSDAIVQRDALKRALEMLERNEKALAVVASSYLLTDPVSMKVWGRMYGWGFEFTLINRKVFELVGHFNELFYVGEEELFVRLIEKTPYKVLDSPFSCIHLKQKPSLNARIRSYFNILKRYFKEYSEIYIRGFSNLSLRYKLRLFYYLLLPWIIVFCITTFLSQVLKPMLPLSLTLLLVYPVFGLYSAFRELAKKGAPISYVVEEYFLHNVPCGVAFVYGVLFKVLWNTVRKIGYSKA
jgi:glycosyltransferase involved in cell wall biosynthesis